MKIKEYKVTCLTALDFLSKKVNQHQLNLKLKKATEKLFGIQVLPFSNNFSAGISKHSLHGFFFAPMPGKAKWVAPNDPNIRGWPPFLGGRMISVVGRGPLKSFRKIIFGGHCKNIGETRGRRNSLAKIFLGATAKTLGRLRLGNNIQRCFYLALLVCFGKTTSIFRTRNPFKHNETSRSEKKDKSSLPLRVSWACF